MTRSERYATSLPFQTEVDIQVYQGDDEDALKNVPVGDFRVEGLTPLDGPNEILCRMRLDLDGILEVTAVEKATGKSRHVTIANALRARTPDEIAEGQARIRDLYASRAAVGDDQETSADADTEALDPGATVVHRAAPGEAGTAGAVPPVEDGHDEARRLLARSRRLFDRMHPDDREEAIELHDRIEAAIEAGSAEALGDASRALAELLFFVEGSDG